MEKKIDPRLFANDGSFMERFKQLQEEKEKKSEESQKSKLVTSTPKTIISKPKMEVRPGGSFSKTNQTASSGKLAFSLKQKSKLVAPPVKFDEDEDEDERGTGNLSDDGPMKRQKLSRNDGSDRSLKQVDVVPPSPSDPAVKNVADRLAIFVAKNGRQLEHLTRQKNPGDTPFKFLYDESCSDYKYYEYRVNEEEKSLGQTRDSQTSQSGFSTPVAGQRSHNPDSKYQTPRSALYEPPEHGGSASSQTTNGASSGGPTGSDPIAMMEYYMKKAAQEEKLKPYKASKDEMPPPASLLAPTSKKGHHMGDYIPQEELEKFLANCNDVHAQKAAREAAERNQIQADNVGHKLLSKMGWKEGEGLGSSRSGIAAPIMAGDVKKDNLGVGAHAPGEVTPEDDIYEQYKKRMMLGYKHRPNPLNNPRKSYY